MSRAELADGKLLREISGLCEFLGCPDQILDKTAYRRKNLVWLEVSEVSYIVGGQEVERRCK